MSKFSDRLKKLRKDHKLSQKQLAESLHVSQNAIFNWENAKREPSFEMAEKIADYFSVKPAFLLGWEDYLQIDANDISEMLKDEKNMEYVIKFLSLDSSDKETVCYFINFIMEKEKWLP